MSLELWKRYWRDTKEPIRTKKRCECWLKYDFISLIAGAYMAGIGAMVFINWSLLKDVINDYVLLFAGLWVLLASCLLCYELRKEVRKLLKYKLACANRDIYEARQRFMRG